MYVIGISAFYHDSAACLLKNGVVIAAAQEERFSRVKHDAGFPKHAIKYCLEQAEISGQEVDLVAFYEKPFLKFERLLETYIAFAPNGFKSFAASAPIWIKDKLFQKSLLINELEAVLGSHVDWAERLVFSEHHLSHAASAFYPSCFERAAILTIDGVGEWTTTSVAIGNGNNLKIIKEIHFPHSLGLLYSAFTYYAGFKVNSGEYKLMGLAPYGKPRYSKVIQDNIINVADDGSFQIDMQYFDYATDVRMTSGKFHKLFGGEPRDPETEITQREMDLAASIQFVTEDIVTKIVRNLAKETGEKNLCLAGGVALNCVINGNLAKQGIFDNIWVQPAAGDAGGALGAALSTWHIHLEKERVISTKRDAMNGSFLGPEFSDKQVAKELEGCGAVFQRIPEIHLFEAVVEALIKGKAIGWMQGRMEFGPRALGNRSIIADPRSPFTQRQLNLKVKFRESFRPFAPSVLCEHVNDWFEFDNASPYMLFVANVQKSKRRWMSASEQKLFGIDKLNVARSSIPAVTHVDYSARIQTVHRDTNARFYDLLSNFKKETGIPILVNTSFNVRGEPIVCTPTDAFKCFMGTDLELLVVGDHIMYKENQDPSLLKSYKDHYDLD